MRAEVNSETYIEWKGMDIEADTRLKARWGLIRNSFSRTETTAVANYVSSDPASFEPDSMVNQKLSARIFNFRYLRGRESGKHRC